MTMPPHDWLYPAQLVRVIDGDTVICNLDAGMRNYRVERLRLARINTPEINGPDSLRGKEAKFFTLSWLTLTGDWPFLIRTVKTDNYGRWLATIWRIVDGRCLNDDLLANGLAEVYP